MGDIGGGMSRGPAGGPAQGGTGPLLGGQQAEALGKSLEVRRVGWRGAGSYGRFVSWDDITGAPSPQKSIGSSEQRQVLLSPLQQKQAGYVLVIALPFPGIRQKLPSCGLLGSSAGLGPCVFLPHLGS